MVWDEKKKINVSSKEFPFFSHLESMNAVVWSSVRTVGCSS